MSKRGVPLDGSVYNALLSGCCKEEKLEQALELFRDMLEKGLASTLSFNTLIEVLCKCDNL